MTTKAYTGKSIVVEFDAARCIHAAECVAHLPVVFNPQARPWIQPANADEKAIAATVRRCPTGALTYRWQDGRAGELPETNAEARVQADGPVQLRGDITLTDPNGKPVAALARVALCRCGASANKPFCDGAHANLPFADAGLTTPSPGGATAPSGPITLIPRTNGPITVSGPLAVRDAQGALIATATTTALCRCGASANKPFCDGSHTRIGFKA